MRNIEAKLGKMRKPQSFTVYPRSTSAKPGDNRIIVQSNKSIGMFDPETGEGVLNTKGSYFPHLALGAPFQFPTEFVKACIEAQPKSGELIGSSSITGPIYVA